MMFSKTSAAPCGVRRPAVWSSFAAFKASESAYPRDSGPSSREPLKHCWCLTLMALG